MVLFIDGEKKLLLVLVELVLVKIAVHLDVGFIEELTPFWIFLEPEKLLILRHAQFNLEHFHRRILPLLGGCLSLGKDITRFFYQIIDLAQLGTDQLFHAGPQPGKRLFALNRGGS